jgi:hypothetical protein
MLTIQRFNLTNHVSLFCGEEPKEIHNLEPEIMHKKIIKVIHRDKS